MRGNKSVIGLMLWSCCAGTYLQAAPPAAAPPEAIADQPSLDRPQSSARQTQEWIADLAAAEYVTRREAFMRLWEQGTAALPSVHEAAAHSDQQIAGTAQVLELLLKLEIKPQDNAELAELLQMSRVAMHRAIMSLAEKGHWRLATELLRSNQPLLDAYRRSGRTEWLCMVVQSAFDQGDARKAWPILQQLLTPAQVYWLSTKANVELDESTQPQGVDHQALQLLFQGEYEKAWALNPSIETRQRIVFLSGRWEWLQHDALRTLIAGGDPNSLSERAKQAAYAYLSNEVEKSDEMIRQVVAELESQPTDAAPPPEPKGLPGRRANDEWMIERRMQELAVGLLVCGEGDAVHGLIPKNRQRENLVYYGARLEYEHILEAFGLSADLDDFDTWLDSTIATLGPSQRNLTRASGDFEQLADLAAIMVAMGKVSEGLKLYAKLIDVIQDPRQAARHRDGWGHLASQGRQTQFRSHLIRVLDQRSKDFPPEARQHYFNALFPDWIEIAPALWKNAPPELVQVRSEETSEDANADASSDAPASRAAQRVEERPWHLMERLWRYDQTLVVEPDKRSLVESWLKNSLRDVAQLEETLNKSPSHAMSQIAMHLGMRSLALSFARSGRSRSARADVAKVYMHENAYESANLLWEAAVESEPWRHVWILEYVNSLAMVGEDDKARQLEESRWLRPLSAVRTEFDYWSVANQLQDQGLYEKAREYAYAAYAMFDPNGPQLLAAARTYAEIAHELEDSRASADARRVMNLTLLVQPDLELSLLQHFISEEFCARALADLDAGQVDSALDRIERFERLRPAGIEICEHAYARLVKNGRQDAADALFERCSTRMLDHLERWPNDAGSHNNLAWMYARCNRQLDNALQHAQRAVELAGDAPTYIDTLAETHFRLGNLDQALELAVKCVDLDPRHAHYRKQVQRFREARRASSR